MKGCGGEGSGLNLLSLDGGGITGLSSLLIVKGIMTRLQAKDQLPNMPKPCEYFDMISGTGTGGISAVMLGRLRMGIDDAITTYVRLMRTVFSKRKYTITGDTGAFKSTVLKGELEEIIRRETGDKDEKMLEDVQFGEVQCRVVVYAMSSYNMTSSLPVAFRSYHSTTVTTSCTIWEALRATTTHPQMFKSIEVDVDGSGVRNMFTHGGLGCANPTPRLLEEARQVYSGRVVASIISIGSGHPKTIRVATRSNGSGWAVGGSIMMRVMQAAQEMAEGSEQVAEEMARRFTDVELGYYRLNVQQGTQGIEASEWERLDEIAAHTWAYLDQTETKSKLERLVGAISQRIGVLETAQIGREKHTEKVRACFTSGLHGRYVFVLYGLGGSGKTQIALRCVEQLGERFMHVFFVDASSDESIQTSLATIALNYARGKTYKDVLKWISQNGSSCLIVFDNADDPNVNLQSYMPQSADYSVLITTRCPEFTVLAENRNAVCNVSGLEENEAVELLLKTAKLSLDQMNGEETAAMYKLLKSFDYLALAVVQAGAYIQKMQLSISQYWERYSPRRQKLPEHKMRVGLDGYSKTVYTTWELSLNQLSSYAKELLYLIAFLHRDGILEEIFERAARNIQAYASDIPSLPEQLVVEQQVRQSLSHLVDDGNRNGAFTIYIGELMSFSLATYNQQAQAYSTHPLVQSWAQVAASRQGISLQHSALLLALSVDWDKSGMDYGYKRRILPHVNLVLEQGHVFNPNVADRFAEVYRAMGRFHDEAVIREHTVSTLKQQLREQHPRTLAAMSSLARAYQEQRRLAEAKDLQDATLAAQKQVLGEEHLDTLETMHRLGWTLCLQGQYVEAETLLTTVVAARKRILGDDHRDTLETMDDLASIYDDQDRLTEAEGLRLTVTATRKKILGQDHADTLEGMSNLAWTYGEQGRLEKAEAMYRTVVAAQKRVLGEDHPNSLLTAHGLAYTYQKWGRLKEAEALYAAVVATRKRVLGEDHPHTLLTAHGLAYTYQKWGRLKEAEVLYATVVVARKRVLGEDHPHTLLSTHQLAFICEEQGRLEEAEALYTTVVAARKQVLGEDHRNTLISMNNLAYNYYLQHRFTEAEALQTAVLASHCRALGSAHPDSIQAMRGLEAIYSALGKTTEHDTLQAERVAISFNDSL
ncbi:hypothetical protein FRC11_006868 [Ceratobasidium sp. 423]|nr:hypothetical protein FRC11_006868 [Ceratobasidium sp. 423]